MIRLARRGDLPAVLDIYNEAIVNTTAIYDYRPHTLADREAWYDQKLAAGLPLYVFEENGVVIGYATYGPFRTFPAYKYTVEHSVYVHKDHRGRKIGARLLQTLIETLNEKGYATLIGGIDADNAGSCRMHEKMGFRQVGEITRAGYKFGRWLTLRFYQYDLVGPAMPTEE